MSSWMFSSCCQNSATATAVQPVSCSFHPRQQADKHACCTQPVKPQRSNAMPTKLAVSVPGVSKHTIFVCAAASSLSGCSAAMPCLHSLGILTPQPPSPPRPVLLSTHKSLKVLPCNTWCMCAVHRAYRVGCQRSRLVKAHYLCMRCCIQLVRLQCSNALPPQPGHPHSASNQDDSGGNRWPSCYEQVNHSLNGIFYVICILIPLDNEDRKGGHLENQGEGAEDEVVLQKPQSPLLTLLT